MLTGELVVLLFVCLFFPNWPLVLLTNVTIHPRFRTNVLYHWFPNKITAITGFGDRLEVAWAGFSLWSNARHLFTTKTYKDYFPALDGAKSFGILWYVCTMSWIMGIVITEIWTTGKNSDWFVSALFFFFFF